MRLCLGLIVLIAAGCTPGGGVYATCEHPDLLHQELAGNYIPCNGADDWCQCLPVPPSGWEPYASLVWTGPEAEAPDCDALGLARDWRGYSGVTPPPECGTCNCAVPVGSCRLPLDFTAYAASGCPATGATQTSFDAPGLWNGSCTTANAIPDGKPCGNTSCVQSLSVDPMLVVEQTTCNKVDPPPARVATDDAWETFGVGCRVTSSECVAPGDHCVPSVKGFRMCIHALGEEHKFGDPFECSAPFTEKIVFYEVYDDKRSCSECSCGPPVGSTCTSQISVYSNDTCSGAPLEEWTHSQVMMPHKCIDLSPGVALGSKKASPPIYTPGACEPSGGEPVGSVERDKAHTVCCLP